MRSINGYFLFELGKIWQLLDLTPGQPVGPQLAPLGAIISLLQRFIADERNQLDLADSVAAAGILKTHLEKVASKPDSVIEPDHKAQLLHILTAFNDRLFNELGRIHVWVLEEKGAFGINTLWRKPLKLVAAAAVPHLSDFVIENVGEAAKCLLLDRFTAVGFHATRSVECVARRYYEFVTGNSPPYKPFKTLGTIIDELKKHSTKGGHLEMIVGNLVPLNELYRKTLSHPDIHKLDEDQAINALTQATDVIGTMIRDATTGGTHFTKSWKSGEKF